MKKTVLIMLTLLCSMLQASRAANGLFDTPKQAFTYEAKTPGLIHLKILMSHASANCYLKESYFYVKDKDGNKTNFFYATETNSSTSGKVIGTYRNEYSDNSTMFMTNGTDGEPKWLIKSTNTQHESLRDGTNPGYMEIDWFWPAEFAGKKYTWGVEGKLYNNGNTISYSKEIGDIDFEEISFETFDAIIGTNQGEEGCVTIPFMSDKPINWVEGKWTDAYGNERKVKETLPEKTYNGFLRIPACEVHKGLVLVANLTTASWKDERSGDPDHNESCISKTVGDVPMLHAPRAFNAETVYDGKGSVLLTWRVDDMDQTDIIDGDVFQIQRSLTGRMEDFEDLILDVFDSKQSTYSYKDSLLVEALKQEHVDAELNIPIVRYRIRRASTSQWGWINNPTVAYEQPQFRSMRLLKPKELRSEWLNQDDYTVKLTWDYEASDNDVYYLWDERAEMSVQTILYNRKGAVLDTLNHVLTTEERNAKTLQVNLTRSCAYYVFQISVDGKDSPIAQPTGDLYVKIRSEEDFIDFANRVNNGENTLNAILLDSSIRTDNVIIGNNKDKPYCGVFEGNGNSIYYTISGSTEALAPFQYTGDGFRLRNTSFRTTINTSKKFASNMVGEHVGGLGMIEHCFNDGKINSSINGDGSHGTVVGIVDAGAMYINKCSSSIYHYGKNTINCGGFVGWKRSGAFCHIMNSKSRVIVAENTTGCVNFMRSYEDAPSVINGLISNSYYDFGTSYGKPQGANLREMNLSTDQELELLGWLPSDKAYYTYINYQAAQPTAPLLEENAMRDDVLQPNFTVLSYTGISYSFNASNLFDNNLQTEWYTTPSDKEDGIWYVEFEADKPFIPSDLIITTYKTGDNYPISWVLKGKLNSNDEWQVLREVTDDITIQPVGNTPFYFSITTQDECKYLRFEVSQSSSNSLDISELAVRAFSKGHYYFETSGKILPTLKWQELQMSTLLQWETDEQPIDYFEVLRKTVGSNEDWQVIATNLTDMQYEDKTTSPVYTYKYMVRAANSCEGVTYTYTDSIEAHCVQTGTVEGYVRFADGTGIPDVLVSVSPSHDHPADIKTRSVRTDDKGYYKIDELRYYSQQSGPYTISVNIAKPNLSPDCADGLGITFDTKSNITTNANFTVTSGYKMSGYVMYNGTSIPVPGVEFTVDGHPLSAGGQPVATDFEGKFSFYVMGGERTIQAHKDGHDFYNEGIYKHDFTTDKAQIYFYDDTKVRLIGRVVGGKDQGELPLANSLSRNNLGDNLTIVMALEGDNSSWLVYDNLDATLKERDTVYVHHAFDNKYDYHTSAHTTRHRIELKPDKHTGEYSIELPPAKWKVMQIYAQGYPTLFPSGKTGDVIDLTDSINHHKEVVKGHWLSLDGNDVNEVTVEYNAQYNCIYHAPVVIEYRQLGYDKFDYFGDKQYIAKNLGGNTSTVPLAYNNTTANKTVYTFGHPVFSLDKKYLFQLSAHEKYYWNNNQGTDTIDVVQMKGGLVTVQNEMMGGYYREEVQLDSVGKGTVFIQAAESPYLLTGENALRTVTMTLLLDDTYYEAKPLQAYVLNVRAKNGAKDYLTYSMPQLVDILRDPPGGSSSAKISKGSTLKYSYQMDMSWKAGVTLNFSAGNNLSTFTGVVAAPMGAGGVGGFHNSASSAFSTSLDLVWSGSGQRAFSYTMTATEDISTSSHNKMIGANADVYIGMEQNIIITPAIAIRAIPDSIYRQMKGELVSGRMVEIASGRDDKDSLFHLVREEVVTYGQQFKSNFVHSQEYIVKQLIPSLAEQCRALMFTGTKAEAKSQANATRKPVYLSTVSTDSDLFGVNYEVIWPDDADPSLEDEVARYHSNMMAWINMIAQNEKEKLEATELVQNFDIDGGSPLSYSEDFTSEYSCTNSFTSPISAGTVGYFDSAVGDGAMAALQILGPVAAKLVSGLLSTKAGGTSGGVGSGKDESKNTYVEVSCVGWTFKFGLVPSFAFNVVPKHSESKKFNRKESFSISMDRKSHLDFDIYRVKTGDDNVQNSGVFDVFTDDNFYDLVDYNEPYLKREMDMKDLRYARSFVYRTRAGATCRPYEPERRTIFYKPGTLLDERTKRIENPKIWVDKQSVSGVPYGEPARFTLSMTNDSEQPEAAYQFFNICLDETSNTKGAKLIMDGTPLSGNMRTLLVEPSKVLTKTLEVYAGDDFDYENLSIMLLSLSDENTSAKVSFSVHYLHTAGSIAISTPGDKWIMNTDAQRDERGYYMPVVISGFDKNQRNFDHIEFQYKESNRGDDYWVNLCSFFASDSLMALASGTKKMIPENGNIVTSFYGEGVEMEKAYDLRAVLFCRNGNDYLTSTSKVLSGVKDTRLPRLFSTPEPRNGILGPGDDVIFDFSEAIEHNYLSGITNFEVIGETNETSIQEDPSLLFTGTGYAETEARRNCSGKSVTIDMMIRPDDTGKEMPVFSHGSDGLNMQLWLTEKQHLKVVVGDTSYVSDYSIKSNGFRHIAVVLNNETQELLMYNDSLIGRADSVTYNGYGTFVFGATNEVDVTKRKHYSGRMLETRIWSRAMDQGLLYQNYAEQQLTGYEMGLAAYYPMNEGDGDYITDKAHGAHAKLEHASWALPRGMSLHLDGNEKKDVRGLQLKGEYIKRTKESDYTLMFWFRTNKDGRGALISNGSGHATDTHAEDNFFIGFEGADLKYRTNGNEYIIPGDYSDDKWHHYAMTVNRSHNIGNIYVDRELRTSFRTDSLGGIDGSDVYLGNMVWFVQGDKDANVMHQSYPLTGNIDELCLFSQALPPALITRYSTKSPGGREKGLITYMGFSRQERDKQNDIVLAPYAYNQVVKYDRDGKEIQKDEEVFVDPASTILSRIDQELGAPVQPFQELKNLDFNFVGRDNQLMISLNEPDSRINKRTFYVTVADIPDLNGNYMASPATVSFYVDRNPIRWTTRSIQDYCMAGEGTVFFAKIINTSGSTHTYEIKGLPQWITCQEPVGVIDAKGEVELKFNVNKGLNVGSYDEIIYVVDENGLSEPLLVTERCEGLAPEWYVDNALRQHSMNIVARVMINNAIVTDPEDMVGVFDAMGRCLGSDNVSYDPVTADSKVYLTVYDSTTVATPLYFKLWHAQTGKTHLLKSSEDVTFVPSSIVGTIKQPILLTAGDLYIQKLELERGWNWISLNVYNDDFRNINKLLKFYPWQNGDILTDDSQGLTLIYKNGQWLSNMDEAISNASILPTRTYRIKVQNAAAIEISGNSLKQTSMRTITVKNGWNSIGYTPIVNLDVETALSDYQRYAQDGDVIKSQSAFSMFTTDAYGVGTWEGSLRYMEPGKGYMLKRQGEGTVKFKYNYYEPGSTIISTAQRAPRFYAPGQHASTMTMAAAVTGFKMQPGDHLLALSGGEVCGEANADDEVIYISISGSQEAPVSFVIERNDEWVASSSTTLSFVPNAVSGSPTEPTEISFILADQPLQGWYTLQGYKLQKRPRKTGVYLYNGQKIVIK